MSLTSIGRVAAWMTCGPKGVKSFATTCTSPKPWPLSTARKHPSYIVRWSARENKECEKRKGDMDDKWITTRGLISVKVSTPRRLLGADMVI